MGIILYTFLIVVSFHMQIEKLRPEFRAGLDALTRFVFERTKPKQFGATVMTGPIFARITQSFVDALNNGAVPTITSSWQVSFFISAVDISTFCFFTLMFFCCYLYLQEY